MNPLHFAYGRYAWTMNDVNDGTPDFADDEPDTEVIRRVIGRQAGQRPRDQQADPRRLHNYETVREHGIFGKTDQEKTLNVALIDGDFFRVKHILRNPDTQQEIMHGWRLRRLCNMDGRMPSTAGELCMTCDCAVGDKRSIWAKALVELSLDQVDYDAPYYIRDVIFTNQEYPALADQPRTFNRYGEPVRDGAKVLREGQLICRRLCVIYYAQDSKHHTAEPVEQAIRWLTKAESDEGHGIWDEGKIRGSGKAGHVERVRMGFAKKIKTGIVSRIASNTPRIKRQPRNREVVDEGVAVIDELAFQEAMRRHKQIRTHGDDGLRAHKQYLAADVCCGGGGASGGIEETPFKLVWALDQDIGAARSWSLNWPDATTYHMDIMSFNKHEIATCAYAHAIHCSFSCKAWSKANPYKGEFENNPEDIATTLAAGPLLTKLCPRFVTFENADAFQTIKKHKPYFDAFLLTIISAGYNIRWKIVDLAQYGNPQHRKRLIVIASCSGETLPEFPAPTHGPGLGLKPYCTVREALQGINEHDPLHKEDYMRQRWSNEPRKGMSPAQWDAVLPHGLTTGGPRDIYPDGDREFTIREGMDLQCFRREHKLPEDLTLTKMREIVGNAVPRDLIRMIYASFHKALLETDAKIDKYLNVSIDEEVLPTPAATPARSATSVPLQRPGKRRSSDDSTVLSADEEQSPKSCNIPIRAVDGAERRVKMQCVRNDRSEEARARTVESKLTDEVTAIANMTIIDLTED